MRSCQHTRKSTTFRSKLSTRKPEINFNLAKKSTLKIEKKYVQKTFYILLVNYQETLRIYIYYLTDGIKISTVICCQEQIAVRKKNLYKILIYLYRSTSVSFSEHRILQKNQYYIIRNQSAQKRNDSVKIGLWNTGILRNGIDRIIERFFEMILVLSVFFISIKTYLSHHLPELSGRNLNFKMQFSDTCIPQLTYYTGIIIFSIFSTKLFLYKRRKK